MYSFLRLKRIAVSLLYGLISLTLPLTAVRLPEAEAAESACSADINSSHSKAG